MKLHREVLPPREQLTVADLECARHARERARDRGRLRMLIMYVAIAAATSKLIELWFGA